MTTFQEAKDVVRKKLQEENPDVYVADWGRENPDYWMIMAGDKRYLAGFDSDFASVDDRCFLVSKPSGDFSEMAFISNVDFLMGFTAVGTIPNFFIE
jgi:hypothetical protein